MIAALIASTIGGSVYAAVDPAWAVPVNSLLVIIQLVLIAFFGRRVDAKTTKAHASATDAATASASAAQAAADAARVVKEIGGVLRGVDLTKIARPTPTTVSTETTGTGQV